MAHWGCGPEVYVMLKGNAMMNKCSVRHNFALVLIVAVITVLAAGLLRLSIQVTQAAGLPPRTAPHQPGSESTWEDCTASIELRVRFSREEEARCWQVLWTVVEWQDTLGAWHEVAGWRGTLDEFVNGEGKKVWWVSRKDLGTGPFRWTVYSDPTGKLLMHSKAFHMPAATGQTVVMDVTIKP